VGDPRAGLALLADLERVHPNARGVGRVGLHHDVQRDVLVEREALEGLRPELGERVRTDDLDDPTRSVEGEAGIGRGERWELRPRLAGGDVGVAPEEAGDGEVHEIVVGHAAVSHGWWKTVPRTRDPPGVRRELAMSVLTIERLAGTVGAEIVDADPERMASDDTYAAAIVDALEANGVLVFRELDLDPETQISFCRRVGEIDTSYEGGLTDVPGVIKISLDPEVNSRAEILKGTFFWHIDGCIPMNDECPQMATVLTAAAVAEHGGQTECANTYAGYEALSDDEKARVGSMRVVHSLEASQRM